ncbi:MAG: Wzz/FepE/Etk N-terminal domain-containing protein [Pseudomonadota bacterium]
MAMSLRQYLRVIWARKWLVLVLFAVTASIGSAVVLSMPRLFVAEASLVMEVRPDPLLGNMASPIDLSTQIEIIKSEKVATRAVQILRLDQDPKAREAWLKATGGKKVPMERFFASMLQRGMMAEPLRLSNVITVTFTSPDSAFAAQAANAFAQAAIDTSIALKAEPARLAALDFQERAKELRVRYEEAQARLTKYQQDKGIIISDGQMDQENARLNLLTEQLAAAQAEQAGLVAPSDSTTDVNASAGVQNIRSQISAQQAILNGSAGVWGPNHPERLAVQSRLAGLNQQLNAEISRARSGSSAVMGAAARKISTLRTSLEEQKKRVLSLRFERDQATVLLKDVETAQSAYEKVSKSLSEESERGAKDSNLRLLSAAVEPFTRSNKKLVVGLAASLVGGLLLGFAVAVGLEMLDRRVRGAEDMTFMYGVPVIGVLRPEGSKEPTFRQLSLGPNEPHKPQSSMPLLGAR